MTNHKRHVTLNKLAARVDRRGKEFFSGLLPRDTWQTQARGTNDQEYQIYLSCANDGKGGDITRGGAPLKTYDEWLAS
jgi:hypothetical protein